MKNFIKKISFFIFPILTILAVPSYVLWKNKESFFDLTTCLTENEKYLIGYTYNEDNYFYLKWKNLNEQPKKSVWAVGSSRVLQFREEMFTASFYNGGYTILTAKNFLPFLQSIDSTQYPEYLILGFDQWMFNPNWSKFLPDRTLNFWQNSYTYFPKFPDDYLAVYEDIWNNNLQKDNSLHNDVLAVGLSANLHRTGFRNDGSMYYGGIIEKLLTGDSSLHDFEYKDTYQRIESNSQSFEYGDSIDLALTTTIHELLNYCTSHQIQVIGFLPPYAPQIHTFMQESGNYSYIPKIDPFMKEIFQSYGFEFYDFTNPSTFKSFDNENIDGAHGGEKTYQKMLLSMLKEKSILNTICDSSALKSHLKSANNNYIIYPRY